ncbi:TPA: hypothetical protein ACIYS1_004515, partial [Escherichia coli]
MKTGYTPEQGRGFVRPGETEKQQNRGFSGIKKAAPIRSRLSEQLTYCAKNEYKQWNYISQVTKRHNCRITGKEKATCHGGQCDQCPGLLVDCQPGGRFLFAFKRRGYFSTKGSRANLSGTLRFSVRVNALFISLRVFSRWRMIIDNALFCSSWLFIIITFKTMRRSTSHHGADSNYSFDSMPRLSNSRRKSLFIHPERLSSPSSFMAMLKRSNKSASRRSCTENLSFLLSLVDIVYLEYNNGLTVTMYTNDTTKAKPAGAMNTNGLLTKPLIEVTIMAGTQHTPRLAHTQT